MPQSVFPLDVRRASSERWVHSKASVVLELASIGTAFRGMVLADLGADVVRVE